MVTLAVADCPVLLKHVMEYVVVPDGETTADPEVDSLPENPDPPEAVQLVAFVEFQISVVELP